MLIPGSAQSRVKALLRIYRTALRQPTRIDLPGTRIPGTRIPGICRPGRSLTSDPCYLVPLRLEFLALWVQCRRL